MKVEFVSITKDNVEHFREINKRTLPIEYSDGFYEELVKFPKHNRQILALADGVYAAGMCIGYHGGSVYIKTLAVLPEYQRQGIGKKLVEFAFLRGRHHGLPTATVHVWESNPSGLDFYCSLGFTILQTIEEYYEFLRPAGAWLLSKDLYVPPRPSVLESYLALQTVEN